MSRCQPCHWFFSDVSPIMRTASIIVAFLIGWILFIYGAAYLNNGQIGTGLATFMLLSGITLGFFQVGCLIYGCCYWSEYRSI